jgi:hypothetical protein
MKGDGGGNDDQDSRGGTERVEPDEASLAERVSALETRLQHWRRGATAMATLVVLVAAGFGVAYFQSGRRAGALRASSVSLYDEQARYVGSLDVTRDPYSEEGFVLRLHKDGVTSTIELRLTTAAEIFALESPGPGPAAGIGSTSSGLTGLLVFDRDGSLRTSVTLDPKGASGIAFRDSSGQSRVVMGTTRDGSPVLAIYDEDGSLLWAAPHSAIP